MAMRLILGVILTISIIFVGIVAISYAHDDVQDAAVANGTNDSAKVFNLTENFTAGLTRGMVPMIVYGGIGAIVVVAAAYLVAAGASGR